MNKMRHFGRSGLVIAYHVTVLLLSMTTSASGIYVNTFLTMRQQGLNQPHQMSLKFSRGRSLDEEDPLETEAPSTSHTSQPSTSANPTLSSHPSLTPTTSTPSNSPSAKPSLRLTQTPTISPTSSPTSLPTYELQTVTSPLLEVILGGLNGPLEDDLGLDHWKESTSEYVRQYWEKDENEADFQLVGVSTNVERQVFTTEGPTIGTRRLRSRKLATESELKIVFTQDYDYRGSEELTTDTIPTKIYLEPLEDPEYIALLRDGGDVTSDKMFQNVELLFAGEFTTEAPSPSPSSSPSYSPQPTRDEWEMPKEKAQGLKTGHIILIVCGAILCLVFIGWYVKRLKNKQKELAQDEPRSDNNLVDAVNKADRVKMESLTMSTKAGAVSAVEEEEQVPPMPPGDDASEQKMLSIGDAGDGGNKGDLNDGGDKEDDENDDSDEDGGNDISLIAAGTHLYAENLNESASVLSSEAGSPARRFEYQYDLGKSILDKGKGTSDFSGSVEDSDSMLSFDRYSSTTDGDGVSRGDTTVGDDESPLKISLRGESSTMGTDMEALVVSGASVSPTNDGARIGSTTIIEGTGALQGMKMMTVGEIDDMEEDDDEAAKSS